MKTPAPASVTGALPVAESPRQPNFACLPSRHAPWRAYGAGMALQSALLALVVFWGLHATRQQLLRSHEATLLLFPPRPQPVKIRSIPLRPRRILHRLQVPRSPAPVDAPKRLRPKLILPRQLRLRMPAVVLPRVRQPKLAPVVRPVQFHAPQVLAALHRTAPVATGVFHSAPAPRHPLPEKQVQTGGFGAVAGVAGPRYARRGNLEATGAFNLPIGPGQGNGAGGAQGRRGRLAAAGFGNGMDGPVRAAGGKVTAVGFSNTETGARPPARHAARPLPTHPVEVLYKPRPRYTAMARRKKIQGSVWLAVVFLSTGRVRVLRIIRSLGAGLDGAARQAAARIRFHPAMRAGRPVDFPARIRIRFRLAH